MLYIKISEFQIKMATTHNDNSECYSHEKFNTSKSMISKMRMGISDQELMSGPFKSGF